MKAITKTTLRALGATVIAAGFIAMMCEATTFAVQVAVWFAGLAAVLLGWQVIKAAGIPESIKNEEA